MAAILECDRGIELLLSLITSCPPMLGFGRKSSEATIGGNLDDIAVFSI
jgi:hypothetical protein